MIRIVVVDDHPVVREGLVAVLADQDALQVIGSAGSVEEALEQVGRERPDVILLDLEMPGIGGIEAIPRLVAASPAPRIVVLTAYDEDERVLGATRAGAGGYLLKGAPIEEIARAIRVVHGGESYLAPRVAARLMTAVRSPRADRGLLSERERAVLREVAAGHPNKQIARTLGITERTIKYHVTSLLTKLGADNRPQAVALAAQRGLL